MYIKTLNKKLYYRGAKRIFPFHIDRTNLPSLNEAKKTMADIRDEGIFLRLQFLVSFCREDWIFTLHPEFLPWMEQEFELIREEKQKIKNISAAWPEERLEGCKNNRKTFRLASLERSEYWQKEKKDIRETSFNLMMRNVENRLKKNKK